MYAVEQARNDLKLLETELTTRSCPMRRNTYGGSEYFERVMVSLWQFAFKRRIEQFLIGNKFQRKLSRKALLFLYGIECS